MNPEDIIFGAKAIISGMFQYNRTFLEIDDSTLMPMLKMSIESTDEILEKAGIAEAEIAVTHDELFQHSLEEYVKTWLKHAREAEGDIDERKETEDAVESFKAFYEGRKNF